MNFYQEYENMLVLSVACFYIQMMEEAPVPVAAV